MKEILRILYENNGNCVGLGRSIKSRNLDLYEWIYSQTTFLNFKGYISDNERIYCILNDITSPVYDYFGKLATFTNIFRGYSLNKHKYEKYLRGEELRIEKKKRSDAAKQKKDAAAKIPLYKKKLKSKIQRVEIHNKELYEDGKIEGYDYVTCPETNLRMCVIKENYIKTCLNMTKTEYKEKYPNVKFICDKRMENVKKGLKEINEETGLTKHQTAIEKTKKKLSKIDENGLSGYDKLGQKTRASHMANVDEFGRNGYSQLAAKAILVGNATKADKGLISRPEESNAFKRYKLIINYLTAKHKKELTAGYITGLCGKDGAYHVDHKYSCFSGFKNHISPFLIAHKSNLEMIPWEYNASKHSNCSITLDELCKLANYSIAQSNEEYHTIMQFIKLDIEHNIPANAAYLLERYYDSILSK